MKNQPLSETSRTFEAIKRVTETGDEAWSARELARVLEYSDFRNFLNVIADAREACTQSGHPEEDHFVEVTDMVEIGSGARRPVEDWLLSRYACYPDRGETPPRGHHRQGGRQPHSQRGRQESSPSMDIPYSPQPFARFLAPVGGAMARAHRPNGPAEPSEGLGPGGWDEYDWPMNCESGPCPGACATPDAVPMLSQITPDAVCMIPQMYPDAIPRNPMHPNGVREPATMPPRANQSIQRNKPSADQAGEEVGG